MATDPHVTLVPFLETAIAIPAEVDLEGKPGPFNLQRATPALHRTFHRIPPLLLRAKGRSKSTARQGKARQGKQRKGMAGPDEVLASQARAGQHEPWQTGQGKATQGEARPGKARQGEARRG
eukprot:15452180-Alexandrium_andersonii.AAC.1